METNCQNKRNTTEITVKTKYGLRLLLVKEKASDISRRTLNSTNGKAPNDIVEFWNFGNPCLLIMWSYKLSKVGLQLQVKGFGELEDGNDAPNRQQIASSKKKRHRN